MKSRQNDSFCQIVVHHNSAADDCVHGSTFKRLTHPPKEDERGKREPLAWEDTW